MNLFILTRRIAKSTIPTKSDYYNLKVIINDEKIKVHQTLDIITLDTLLVNINPPKVYINKRRNEFIYFNKEMSNQLKKFTMFRDMIA